MHSHATPIFTESTTYEEDYVCRAKDYAKIEAVKEKEEIMVMLCEAKDKKATLTDDVTHSSSSEGTVMYEEHHPPETDTLPSANNCRTSGSATIVPIEGPYSLFQ